MNQFGNVEMTVADADTILDEVWLKVYDKRPDGSNILTTGKYKHKRSTMRNALECALAAIDEVRELLNQYPLPGDPLWLNGTPQDELVAKALKAIGDEPYTVGD